MEALHGLKVLIVEDETLVAMLIEEYLSELGCEVAFTASRVSKAQKFVQTSGFDVAVLDVNVAGESSVRLAEMLEARGIPFVFASGYGARGVDRRWRQFPVLQKPFTEGELGTALLASLGREKVSRFAPI